MKNSPWTIDAKNHRATHESGQVITFEFVNKDWVVDGRRAAHKQALEAWNAALDEGIQTLTDTGKAMHGNDWMLAISRDIDVAYSSVKRWVNRERPLTMEHPVWESIAQILHERAEAQMNLADKIRERILNVETITSGRYAHSETSG
jgi:nickel-dependent lactate racemase